MKERPKYGALSCIGFMLRCAWRTRKQVPVLCVVIAAMAVAQNLIQLFLPPVILGRIEQSVPVLRLMQTIGLFALSLMLLSALQTYIKQYSEWGRIDVRSGIILDINDKAFMTSYVNTLDPAAQRLRERALQAADGNVNAVEYIWKRLTELMAALAGFAIYLTLLRNMDALLLIVVIATTAASLLAARHFSNWGYLHREEHAQQCRRMDYLMDKSHSVALAKDIRIFGLREWLSQVYDSALGLYRCFIERKYGMYFVSSAIDTALALARNGIAYVYLIRMTLAQGLPASQFLLYFTAITGFTEWVAAIMEQVMEIYRQCLEISCVREYLDWPEPFRFEGGKPIPDAKNGYELRLEGVSYRYPGAQEDTIRGIDLTVRPGERLAVVGLNGAGKTTLVRLLCGLLDPTEGRVLLSGVDVRELNRREYYALFSAVFQDFSVLDATVAENVAQRAEDIDRARVTECLEKAGIARAVDALPQGMDTHVGRKVYLDGVELSGGQTQRLMLARALYKDGPILMLDEPTAALDPIAESDIYQKYEGMTKGKTSVFISHRLASTRFCDRILFLQEGRICEEGTHEALIAQGGGYASLFEVQSRYYREGRDF